MHTITVWPAWLAGAGIGLCMLALLWLTNHQLGVSTTYASLCRSLPGAQSFCTSECTAEWRLWFAAGIVLGGMLALVSDPQAQVGTSVSMGTFYDSALPNASLRSLVVLIGGVLMGLGARMAGGCTSGHTITGVSLCNPASMLASALFFIGGTGAVQLLFRLSA